MKLFTTVDRIQSQPVIRTETHKRGFLSCSPTSIEFWRGRATVWWEIALGRARLRRDFVGYEYLLSYMDRCRLWSLLGNILEIGAFMGGGTRKLARSALAHGKSVTVIDIFDPTFDHTTNSRGEAMCWIYSSILGRSKLRREFDEVTEGLQNILVYESDSSKVTLPREEKFIFSFIDGNHSYEIVTADLRLAWAHTRHGGVVACHDYGGDLPSVTSAIDAFRDKNIVEIAHETVVPNRKLIFLHRA